MTFKWLDAKCLLKYHVVWKKAIKEKGLGKAVSNGDPIHLTIDKTQVRKCEGEKNLYESSANGLNASECEMEINWSIHSTAANYMWQGRQTPEVYGAQRKTVLVGKFEGCLLPLWGVTFAPVRECHCHWITFNSANVWSLYFKTTERGVLSHCFITICNIRYKYMVSKLTCQSKQS